MYLSDDKKYLLLPEKNIKIFYFFIIDIDIYVIISVCFNIYYQISMCVLVKILLTSCKLNLTSERQCNTFRLY